MVKKAKTASKVAAFLSAQVKTPIRCRICDNRAAAKALDEIIAARKSGKSNVTATSVTRFLRAEFQLEMSPSLLLYCCEEHRGELWSSHGKV